MDTRLSLASGRAPACALASVRHFHVATPCMAFLDRWGDAIRRAAPVAQSRGIGSCEP